MGRTTAALVAVLLVNLVSLTNAFHGGGESWSFTKHTYGLSLDVPAKLVCEYLWPGSHSRMVAPKDGNGGYVIRSALVDQLDGKYIVGHQYTVDLVGLVNPFEGFIIQARDRWNEGLILGSFIPLDTSKAQTIHCLGNDHGTVTHNSKDPVSVQSFIWQAPPTLEGSGEVDFVYSVMQSSLQYWVRINASSPVLTYKEVQADGVSPMDAPCPSAPAANAVYRFTATNPPNCVQSSCDYFLGIRTNDNDPTYLDFMLEGNAKGWIGVGFAPGPAMASADVLGCIMVITTDSLAIVDAWNLPASPDNNNVRDDIQNVCPHSANYSSGRIQCVFSRQIVTNDTTQDVPMNGSYYLLYGRGEKPTGSPPTLSYHTAQFTPPISDNPIEPDTASNTPIPTHPCPSSPAANAVYRFTATNPPNCVQSSCDYFLGIRTNDNDPTYLDFMLEGSATGWIGVGFAPAQAMPSADVLGCVVLASSSEVAIVDAWNLVGDYMNVRDSIQNVCPHSASYSNGRIQCVFSRQIITNDTAQDVPMNGSYYLLYGRGETPTGSSPPGLTFHGAQFTPPFSDGLVDPATFEGNSSGEVDELHSVMVRVHGVVMTVAFSIFGVIGIFFAAWMKPVLVQDGCWFQIHRAMMIASLLLGVFGFICIFVAHRHASFRGYYGLVPLDNPGDIIHFTWGIAVMAMLVANPIIALFRCKPNAPRRWIYNLIHGVIVGLLFELLVLANSCLGFYLLGGEGAMFYIYLFFCLFTIVMNIILGFTVAFISHGSEDLPALARTIKLCRSVCQYGRGYTKLTLNDDVQSLLEDTADKKDMKLLTMAVRWITFSFYAIVSITALLIVVVMVTQTIPS